LTLNIPALRQNIKNLDYNFGAIYVRINFRVSSFTGVGGEWGDRRTDMGCQAFLNRSLSKISILPPLLCLLRSAWLRIDFLPILLLLMSKNIWQFGCHSYYFKIEFGAHKQDKKDWYFLQDCREKQSFI